MSQRTLSEQEAYLAMYRFLDAYYQRGPSHGLGVLLGSLSLLPDGTTADPAMRNDWAEAVTAAKNGDVHASLELKRP